MVESYGSLEEKKIDIKSILSFHVLKILESLNRRITFKEKFKNPWTVEVGEHIHFSVFYEWFKAISDYKIEFGRTINIKRNSKNKPSNYTIVLNHFGCFKFHFEKIVGEKISNFLEKLNKSGSQAKVEITSDKQAILDYKVSSSVLSLKVHYNVKNRYGTVCSF